MVASNELNVSYFLETAKMLFDLAKELESELGIKIEFINLGGGIGIPYKPDEKKVDFYELAAGMENMYISAFGDLNAGPNVVMECGRMVTGPYGYLVTKAIHHKNIYKNYI